MSAETYLDDTEPAVRHLFKGLDLYDNIRPPSIMQYVDDTGEVKMSKKETDDLVQASQESFAVEFSRATLAGAILQVAYVGLKEFSKNQTISPQCLAFGVKPNTNAEKCSIGRTVHDIPVGLLIYSARIQYNHWEEGEPTNKVAKNVFRHLESIYINNLILDMVYDLEHPRKEPVSNYIVRNELKWRAYNNYLEEMKAMLLQDGHIIQPAFNSNSPPFEE